MKPLQFTLRDLFLMTALIAVGMGGIVCALRWENLVINPTLWVAWVLACLVLIGTGIVVPFRSRWNKISHYAMIVCRILAAVIFLALGIAHWQMSSYFTANGQLDRAGFTRAIAIFSILIAIVFFPKKFRISD